MTSRELRAEGGGPEPEMPCRAGEPNAAFHTPRTDVPQDLRVPTFTAELPGIGGTIKAIPDDFVVEEIPSYEPSGTGDHLFLWIEKRGVGAEDLTRHIARTLRIHTGEVGVAGMKDRHALTRQFVSVPRSAERLVPEINSSEIQVLSVRPHAQKLRTGHLRGNRFRILVRDVPENAAAIAEPVRDVLLQHGLPNFFGAQRFGRDQETATMGMQLLHGEIAAPPGDWSRKRFLRKLALSAAQAVLYNRYLARRVHDGLLRTVLDGDVMFKLIKKGDKSNLSEAPVGPSQQIGLIPFLETGGIFYVTDRVVEQARFDARETIHAGPIFGKKTFPAHGAALARESAILSDAGITPTQLRSFGPLLSGTRRRNLVYVDDLTITPLPQGLEFRFSLPAGSYATVLLAEFMKSE